MLYREEITKIYNELKGEWSEGEVAQYIPALSEVDPNQYAISICNLKGEHFSIGDSGNKFTIQSISKIFTLAMVSNKMGERLWEFVGREPSGSSFNSLIELEREQGIPRNPFINAGALVVTDKLINLYPEGEESLLEFIKGECSGESSYYDHLVAQSEFNSSYRNQALANIMKSFGTIEHEVEEVVDLYCRQCSITMDTLTLAKSFLFLANGGINPINGKEVVSPRTAKRMNALLLTCGLYNESGDFAYRVGLPGKSGVGGAIIAIVPGRLSIAVWSPRLNQNGNSHRGITTLEQFTTEIGISVF